MQALPVEPPAVEPVAYLPITREEAIALNAQQVPMENVGPAATPFHIVTSSSDGERALRCLTEAIYFEAASEHDDGQRAVAQVVLNRVRNPASPRTVCGVIYQGSERKTGCQFTFTCDGSLTRKIGQQGWLRAERLAKAALNGAVFKAVGNATHYHADWVVPYWASSLTRATNIGAHIFYRWKGAWGTPRAFTRPYIGSEPAPWLSADRIEMLGASHVNDLFGSNRPDGSPPPIPVLADEAHARLKPASERALSGGMLYIDDKPPQLIPSLTAKPQVKLDAAPSTGSRRP